MASNGVYGTKVASNVTENDIEIFYSYSPTRASNDIEKSDFKRLKSNLLQDVKMDDSIDRRIKLDGLKNLKLPVDIFNKKGFYTIYIRPKEVKAVITNISTLTSYPDIKGVVLNINSNELSDKLMENNSLVGYRMILLDDNGNKTDYYRIITSNNKCEPVEQRLTSPNQNTIRYKFNEGGGLSFLTVTPSVAPSFKPNATPYIGKTGQEILIVNTKFEPIMIDLEMVDKDIETVSTMLEGDQLRSLDNGLVTTFNDKNEIYHQSEHYSLKDEYTGKPVYEVKKRRDKSTGVDFTQTLNNK